jgi:hypothetical protein
VVVVALRQWQVLVVDQVVEQGILTDQQEVLAAKATLAALVVVAVAAVVVVPVVVVALAVASAVEQEQVH